MLLKRTISSASNVPKIFDRALKQRQRDLVASSDSSRLADYLRDEVAERVCDRLLVGVC